MKKTCPVCGKKIPSHKGEKNIKNPWRPFCSERCKLIDLGRWASEEYRIPGEKIKEEEDGQEEGNGLKPDGEKALDE